MFRTTVVLCRRSDHCSVYLHWCCTLRLCSSSLCDLVVHTCNKQYVLFLVLLTSCRTFLFLCHVVLWKAFLVQLFLILLLTVNCSFRFFVDRSFRNLFLCCPSCLSCLCVFLFLFLCVFLCCLLLCPLVLLLHCSLLKLLMMDSAVTYWRLCVLFGIRLLLSVSPRMLVTLLHWGEVLLQWSSWLCLIHIVVSRIPSCWMILRNCWCQMLARAVWCSLFLVVFWIVGVP